MTDPMRPPRAPRDAPALARARAQQGQSAGLAMRAWLQHLPRVAAAERLSDESIAALVKKLR